MPFIVAVTDLQMSKIGCVNYARFLKSSHICIRIITIASSYIQIIDSAHRITAYADDIFDHSITLLASITHHHSLLIGGELDKQ